MQILFAVLLFFQQPAQAPLPLIRENATVKVSEHVYVIPDFNVGAVPNVGIVVGRNATLVIDTGLGPRNGQTVLREVESSWRTSRLDSPKIRSWYFISKPIPLSEIT